MSLNLSPQEEEVLTIISPRKFHRLFTLPATESHGALKVSYSIAGPEDGDVPTVLLVGGMFCTRWYNINLDHSAQKAGVRILLIDRLVFKPLRLPSPKIPNSCHDLLKFTRDTPHPTPSQSPIPIKLTKSTDPASAPQRPYPWTKESPYS